MFLNKSILINWYPISFVRFLIFLVIGITFEINFLISNYFLIKLEIILLILFSVYIFIFFIHQKTKNFHFRNWNGIVACIILICLGISLVKNKRLEYTFYKEKVEKAFAYTCVMQEPSVKKNQFYKGIAKITKLKIRNKWENVEAKIQLYFPLDFQPANYGDIFLINSKPTLIQGPKNPFEFDMQKFLAYKGVLFKDYTQKKAVGIGSQYESSFLNFAINIRKKCVEVFDKNLHSIREKAIISALVLGERSEIDQEITIAYSGIGALHVLSVSGLHVGILFLILSLIFKPIQKIKYGNWIFWLIISSLILLYAFVTGYAPCVLRAAIMYILVLLTQTLNRKVQIYNVLSVTAFALLCYDPFYLVDVGFQMSFLALLGIVYFYPIINNWFTFENKAANFVWNTSSLSIAAQIPTFALGMLYFHQFSNIFILSNLVVIPITVAILWLGLFLLLISWIPFLAKITAFLLTKITFYTNEIVLFFEKIPYSFTEDIWISNLQFWLLNGIILSLILLFAFRKFYWIYVCTFFVIFYSFLGIFHLNQISKSKLFVVFQINKNNAIGFYEGFKKNIFTTSAISENSSLKRFYFARFHKQRHSFHPKKEIYNDLKVIKKENSYSTIYSFHNQLIIHFKAFSNSLKKDLDSNIKFDLVLVSNHALSYKFAEKNKNLSKNWIFDATCSQKYFDKMKKYLNNNIHYTPEKGYFSLN